MAKKVVGKIVTQFSIGKEQRLTSRAIIKPGGYYWLQERKMGLAAAHFFFIQDYEEGADNFNPYKNFLVFWSLICGDDLPVHCFEEAIEDPSYVEDGDLNYASNITSIHNGLVLDSDILQLIDFPRKVSTGLTYQAAFQRYMEADPGILNRCKIFLSQSRRGRSRIAPNYLVEVSNLYILIESLMPKGERCPAVVTCATCGPRQQHELSDRRTRLQTLFAGWRDQAELLADIVMKVARDRHLFVHEAALKSTPITTHPKIADTDGLLRRSINLQSMSDEYGVEGLATDSAIVALTQVVRWLLLNKIFNINYWPKVTGLSMVVGRISTGSESGSK